MVAFSRVKEFVLALQLFREHGWAHPEVTSYSRMAADTGRPRDFFAAEMQQGSDYDTRAPFIAATL